MNPSYYRITLDVHDATSQLSFPIKVGDTSRRLLITLMDNGVPYEIAEGCYATFMATKSNKKLVSDSCTIQKNLIIYDISPQASASEGKLDCEITLFGTHSEQLTSPRFTIIVYATTGYEADSEIIESNEYKSLTTLIAEATATVGELHAVIDETNALIDNVEDRLENGDFVGEQGEQGIQGIQGAKIVSTDLVGTDEDGGNVYQQTFDDGSTAEFTAPKGEQGASYVLTDDDKEEIASDVAEALGETNTEEWVFTLEDGTTVTKEVYIKSNEVRS